MELLREFRRYMLTIPKVKDSGKRWQSTADVAAHRPARNLAYWQQYDPPEANQVPYVARFLTSFSQYITQIGLKF